MHTARIFFFAFTSISFIYSVSAQQPEWYSKIKELSLLNSNYEDVIGVYDLASKVENQQDLFHRYLWAIDSDDGVVDISLKEGEPCSDGSTMRPGWNVPEWTVVGIVFIPNWKKQPSINQPPFSLAGFDEGTDENGRSYYWSHSQGIQVSTESNKNVSEISFFPPLSMAFMHCKE